MIGPPKNEGVTDHHHPPRPRKVQTQGAQHDPTHHHQGNLTRDPNGGYGKDTGKAYTHLDIAVTDRIRNNQGDWVDGPPTYYRVTTFGKTAENALNSLNKGNAVIATGELTVHNYTRTDGTTGIAHEIIADHLEAALTYTGITIKPKTTAQTNGPNPRQRQNVATLERRTVKAVQSHNLATA